MIHGFRPKKKKKEFENITTLDLGGNFKQAGNLNPIPSVTELFFFDRLRSAGFAFSDNG